MYKQIVIKELKETPKFHVGDYFFELIVDNFSYLLVITKAEQVGIRFAIKHNEERCHACKGTVKKEYFCFNLFTLELYREIVEYMLFSSTFRVKLMMTHHDLHECLKKELAFICQLEEEYQ